MALQFTFGRWQKPGLLRPQWGVRGSLFAAFTVIAAMAIVISAGAGLVLGHLGGAMLDLSKQDIPRLAASLQLAAQSASLASQGPALLASRSADALDDRARKMKQTLQVALAKLEEITELGADKTVVAALGETVKNIDDTIRSLDSAARERLELAAQHDKQYSAVRAAQAAFVAAAGPAMMNAQTQINAVLGSAQLDVDDATHAARTVNQLGNVIASGHQAAAELNAALSANNSDTLEAIEKEFKDARARVLSNLDPLPKDHENTILGEAAQNMLALGEAKTGVFKVRQKQLDANDYGEILLEEAGKLNVGLGTSVQQLVEAVRSETNAATALTRREISLATIIMLALGGLTLVGSALFVWLYVGRSILRRIGELQRSMQRLSAGDLQSEIYQSRQHDEIAAMASSLQVFRESMIQGRSLSAEQDSDRAAKAERASRMEASAAR